MKRSRRPHLGRLVVALVFLLGVLAAGCGGHGGSNNTSTNKEQFVLHDNVYVVPNDGSVSVESVTDTTVVLKGAVPETLASDWTIINNELPMDKEFIRKVANIARVGDTVTITTGEATLVDIFNDAQIQKEIMVPASVLAYMQAGTPGITFGDPNKARSRDLSFEHQINFNQVEVKGDDNVSVLASIDGNLKMQVGFETGLDVGVHGVFDLRPKINKFRVAPFVKVDGDLTMTGKVNGNFTRQIPISLPLSFPIAGLGPVPVNVNLQLLLQVEGRIQADGKLRITGGIDMAAGIDCTNDQWSTVQRFDHNFTVDPPKFKAQASLNLSALKPEISVGIPGIGDMFVRADALRAGMTIEYRTVPAPAGYVVTSKGDFQFTAGGTLKLGPITAFDGEFAKYSFGAFNLGAPFFLPDTAQLVLFWNTTPFLEGKPRRIYVVRPDGSELRSVLPENTTKDQAQPYLSWDSKKIVYVNSTDIWEVNTDGTDDHMIYHGDFNSLPARPSWRSTNTEIYFDMKVNGVRQVFTMSAGGGQPTQLTNDAVGCFAARGNPDGDKIVYNRLSGNNCLIDEMIVSTKAITPLVTDDGFYRDPNYSPDGENVIFWDQNGIWLWTSGSGAGLLVSDAGAAYPSFGPDGEQIIYSEGANTYISNIAGENPRLLTDLGQYASWQFDR